MDRDMTARRPTGPIMQVAGMVHIADIKRSRGQSRPRRLRMASQAQVVIAHGEKLRIDRAMGIVAGGAAFAHGGMLEYDRFGLFAMAAGAGFVEAGHGESAGGFHDVLP